MARKLFMSAYDEKSKPSEDILTPNGVAFGYDKPFFLICNFPIQDKAYFEFIVDDYYPISSFHNIPLYAGISKEVSFGVLNSDFLIGSLYYKDNENYDIMSKYSKQFLNYHTNPIDLLNFNKTIIENIILTQQEDGSYQSEDGGTFYYSIDDRNRIKFVNLDDSIIYTQVNDYVFRRNTDNITFFFKVDKNSNYTLEDLRYTYAGISYTKTVNINTGYFTLTGTNGIVYVQSTNDSVYRKNDRRYFKLSTTSTDGYLFTESPAIHTRLPGSHDVIGVGVDFSNNCVNMFVNGKLFYSIQNKTYDEDGNTLTSFDISDGKYYFCIWSNVYYKKVLVDFNQNSEDTEIEHEKRIKGIVNFGTTDYGYKPDGYKYMYEIYASYVNPPDEEDDDGWDSHPFDPSLYDGYNSTIADIDSVVDVNNLIDVNVNTLGLYCIEEDKKKSDSDRGVVITDKYKYSMDATIDEDEEYFKSGYTIFINKPIPVENKIYFEFYATKSSLKDTKIGIPLSAGVTNSFGNITVLSSRTDLFHEQWYHYYWKEMSNKTPSYSNWVQHLHEINDVFLTVPPIQGDVIGVALNLAKNKMTLYVDNTKFYTMRMNCAQDKESEEMFTIGINESNKYMTLTGKNGTTYTQISSTRMRSNSVVNYDIVYNSHSGRLELYEVGGTIELIYHPILGGESYYTINGERYNISKSDTTGYMILTSEDGNIVYTQFKSDVMTRNTDGINFEMYVTDDGYKLIKVHSTKKINLSYDWEDKSRIDYSKPYEFTYFFIHDEGAFSDNISGSFNFGQEPFAATMPDGYRSLWDYYTVSSKVYASSDIVSKVTIVNDRNIYASLVSQVKIVNTGANAAYKNNGLNKLMLTFNNVSDTEDHYYSIEGIDLTDFNTLIARENNGYIPDEKMNTTTISFEGVVHYTINIPTLENQHVEAYLNGKTKYTTTFQAPKGSVITIKVVPDNGYVAGVASVSKVTLVEDIDITVSPATLKEYTVSILPTTNQTIEVIHILSYKDNGDIDKTKTYYSKTDSTVRFIATKNSSDLLISISADTGYNAGETNIRTDQSYRVEKDTTIYADPAEKIRYNVTIPATEHFIAIVRYNNITYRTDNSIVVQIPYQSTLFIDYLEDSVETGYKVVEGFATSQIITGDTTVILPEITDDMCTLTVNSNEYNGLVRIVGADRQNGNVYTIRRGNQVTIIANPNQGYYTDKFTLE